MVKYLRYYGPVTVKSLVGKSYSHVAYDTVFMDGSRKLLYIERGHCIPDLGPGAVVQIDCTEDDFLGAQHSCYPDIDKIRIKKF